MKDFDLLALLNKYEDIAIFTHIRPDGDAIGSSLALGIALKQMGKNVSLFCPDKVPAKYSFLPGVEEFQENFSEEKKADLAFILDCSDLDRVGWMKERIPRFDTVINIDHHITSEQFGNINLVDPTASSTGELIFQLLHDNNFDLNYEISLSLYTAISSDTGSFKFENTTPRTMKIAGALLEKGINPALVSQKLFDEYPVSTIFLLRDSLATLEFNHTRQIAWMSIHEKMLKQLEAEPEEMDGFVNYLKNIAGVEVGVFFYHTDDKGTKIGFRSKTVDVARIAETFGGGGHLLAAGCTVQGTPPEIIKKVINVINCFLVNKDALIYTE